MYSQPNPSPCDGYNSYFSSEKLIKAGTTYHLILLKVSDTSRCSETNEKKNMLAFEVGRKRLRNLVLWFQCYWMKAPRVSIPHRSIVDSAEYKLVIGHTFPFAYCRCHSEWMKIPILAQSVYQ